MELHPIGESNGNVVQGVAVDLEGGHVWTSTDMSSFSENVLVNRLSLSSGLSSYCEEFTEDAGIPLGHGQDLSLSHKGTGTPEDLFRQCE